MSASVACLLRLWMGRCPVLLDKSVVPLGMFIGVSVGASVTGAFVLRSVGLFVGSFVSGISLAQDLLVRLLA